MTREAKLEIATELLPLRGYSFTLKSCDTLVVLWCSKILYLPQIFGHFLSANRAVPEKIALPKEQHDQGLYFLPTVLHNDMQKWCLSQQRLIPDCTYMQFNHRLCCLHKAQVLPAEQQTLTELQQAKWLSLLQTENTVSILINTPSLPFFQKKYLYLKLHAFLFASLDEIPF